MKLHLNSGVTATSEAMDIRDFDHQAEEIASPAEVETLSTFKNRIDHYRNQNYSYIPIPADWKYYVVEDESLEELSDEQIIADSLHLATVLVALQDQPFLLVDRHYGSAYTVVDGREIPRRSSFSPEDRSGVLDRLRREAAENEEVLLLHELRDRYPELVNHVSGPHTSYDEQYMIITLADLNKRPVREMLYRLLHELESNLADKIQAEYPDSEDILKYVRSPAIGRWKKDQIRGLQLHVAEHLNIIDIMQVVQASSSTFVDECGFSSKPDVQNSLGRIDNIRNRVMHSTRSLVYARDDVESVLAVIETSERILNDMD